MLNFLVPVAFWSPLPLAVAGYVFTRRSLPHSRSLLVFDCAAVLLGILLCVGFFWREITGHISEGAWLDEAPWMGLLAPFWIALISVSFFVLAAAVRARMFSKPQPDATRAA